MGQINFKLFNITLRFTELNACTQVGVTWKAFSAIVSYDV